MSTASKKHATAADNAYTTPRKTFEFQYRNNAFWPKLICLANRPDDPMAATQPPAVPPPPVWPLPDRGASWVQAAGLFLNIFHGNCFAPRGSALCGQNKKWNTKRKNAFHDQSFLFFGTAIWKNAYDRTQQHISDDLFWWPFRLKFLLSRDPATSVTQRTQPPENDAPGKNVLFAGNESFMGVVRGN